jgi:hypothetical protein
VKIRTGIILAAVVVVGAVAYFFVRAAEDRVTDDMVSRAGQFSIPSDWKLEDNVVRREMFLCMETNPCPSIARRWSTGRELTVDDLRTFSSKAPFAMNVEGTCSRRPNVGGPTTVCSSSGNDGVYDYSLNVSSPGKNDKSTVVVLLVEAHR